MIYLIFKNEPIEGKSTFGVAYAKDHEKRTWTYDVDKAERFFKKEDAQVAALFCGGRVVEDDYIREYFDSYMKVNFNKFSWEISQDDNSVKLYEIHRKRKAPDEDFFPYTDSIEREAIDRDLWEISFTDIFGIIWYGARGKRELVGAPDFEQHLYYRNRLSDNEEPIEITSFNFTRTNPPKNYLKLKGSEGDQNLYVFFDDLISVRYNYMLTDSLFKATSIEVRFVGKEDTTEVYYVYNTADNYKVFIRYLKKKFYNHYQTLMQQINTHFLALKNSNNPGERALYPGKTAEEYFK